MGEREKRESDWRRLLSLREAGQLASEVVDFLSDALNAGLGVPNEMWGLVETEKKPDEETPLAPPFQDSPLFSAPLAENEADADATIRFDVAQHGELGTTTGNIKTLDQLIEEAGQLPGPIDGIEPAKLVFVLERLKNREPVHVSHLPESWRERVALSAELLGLQRLIRKTEAQGT